MKEYSDWPTFPQLFIKGEFVGGADIVRQMHETGELEKKLGDLVAAAKPPTLTVIAARRDRARRPRSSDGSPGDVIHLTITPALGAPARSRRQGGQRTSRSTSNGVTVQLDRASAAAPRASSIDFIEGADGAGFKIENPNRPATVQADRAQGAQGAARQPARSSTSTTCAPTKERDDRQDRRARSCSTTRAMAAIEELPEGHAAGVPLPPRRPQPRARPSTSSSRASRTSTTSPAASTRGRARSIRRSRGTSPAHLSSRRTRPRECAWALARFTSHVRPAAGRIRPKSRRRRSSRFVSRIVYADQPRCTSVGSRHAARRSAARRSRTRPARPSAVLVALEHRDGLQRLDPELVIRTSARAGGAARRGPRGTAACRSTTTCSLVPLSS